MTAASGLGSPPPLAPAEEQRQRCGGGHGGKCGQCQPPTIVASVLLFPDFCPVGQRQRLTMSKSILLV